ncbi:acyl-CoA dehydrogenase [Actinomadura spongiicola]|uniref:short-chain 2-methylacyl-CoA dehydrogenase n=1 Tax=Actinomadura spongiicola TaxID=2303421 RepID=A0A372GC69_9ACTN|nr:acyl-CoA dehydrogenase family protein [Actinomadura spongiicola]RFS82984.1 acyl-CoA dehydrogenase [Actinomadura spongiicola]
MPDTDTGGPGPWRARVRAFAEDAVAPLVDDMDHKGRLDDGLVAALFAEGLMGMETPVHYGGQGRTFPDVVTAVEEIARVCSGVAVAVDVHNILVTGAILRDGDGDQRRRHLPRLASATMGAFALSEEGAGSDAFALATVAEPDGRGWRLTGRKRWTSNALAADLFLVFARTGPHSVTAFLVERDAPGLTVTEPADQLGVRAARTADVVLDGVPVRHDRVLGGVGRGELLALRALTLGRVGIAAQLVGLARGALDVAARHVSGRSQFGRPVAEFQGVRFPLAESAAEVAAAGALTRQAADACVNGADEPERIRLAAMAKYVASQAAQRAAIRAVDAMGGNGTRREHRAEKFYRDAKVGTIYEGTSNILLNTIASELLSPARTS